MRKRLPPPAKSLLKSAVGQSEVRSTNEDLRARRRRKGEKEMKQISKEDLVPMDTPGDGWYHIESNEEHPTQRESGEIVQVLYVAG